MMRHYTTTVIGICVYTCLELYKILAQEMPINLTSNHIPTVARVTLMAFHISLYVAYQSHQNIARTYVLFRISGSEMVGSEYV